MMSGVFQKDKYCNMTTVVKNMATIIKTLSEDLESLKAENNRLKNHLDVEKHYLEKLTKSFKTFFDLKDDDMEKFYKALDSNEVARKELKND